MFQFRRFPTLSYLIQITLLKYGSSGFPHSDISGSMLICSSPKLFAAYHVLHRLLMPRHSPCALISLTSSESASASFRFRPQPSASGENYAHSVAPPLKFEPASLGFKFVPKSKAPCWSICSVSNLEKSNIGSLIQNYAGSLRSLS